MDGDLEATNTQVGPEGTYIQVYGGDAADCAVQHTHTHTKAQVVCVCVSVALSLWISNNFHPAEQIWSICRMNKEVEM